MSDRPPWDWERLRSMGGGAGFVPQAIHRMLHAVSTEDAGTAYWQLDNRVVVQGQLFEAAQATAHEVATAPCRGDASNPGLCRALDILVEIASGEPDRSEIAIGNTQLADRCRVMLRQFLPCWYSIGESKDERVLLGLLDLLEVLEDDARGFGTLPRRSQLGRGWQPQQCGVPWSCIVRSESSWRGSAPYRSCSGG